MPEPCCICGDEAKYRWNGSFYCSACRPPWAKKIDEAERLIDKVEAEMIVRTRSREFRVRSEW